jgi:hypothetical protein
VFISTQAKIAAPDRVERPGISAQSTVNRNRGLFRFKKNEPGMIVLCRRSRLSE